MKGGVTWYGKPPESPAMRAVTLLEELIQQAAPLLPKEVGSGQAAVSTDHAQVGDAVLHQVVCGLQAALVGSKLFAAGAADDRATLRKTQMIIWNCSLFCWLY